MKNLVFIIALSFAFVACSSDFVDNENSCKDILCKKEWNCNGMLGNRQVIDDTYKFNKDGSVTFTQNGTTLNGVWHLGDVETESENHKVRHVLITISGKIDENTPYEGIGEKDFDFGFLVMQDGHINKDMTILHCSDIGGDDYIHTDINHKSITDN